MDQGWEHPSKEVQQQHSTRHFTRFRGLVLMTAFKAAATSMQSGLPWAKDVTQWDQVQPFDPELDVNPLIRSWTI